MYSFFIYANDEETQKCRPFYENQTQDPYIEFKCIVMSVDRGHCDYCTRILINYNWKEKSPTALLISVLNKVPKLFTHLFSST